MSSERLLLVGLSHHTTPLEIREKLAISATDMPATLRALKARAQLSETMVVSTCNRVEIYGASPAPNDAVQGIRAFLGELCSEKTLPSHLYEHIGPQVTRHAFRVASSLDSLVVGEPQILGQVKDAFGVATETGTIGALLGRCVHRAFAVAKRVRSETGIAAGAVSVSSIACDLAKSIFGELTGRRVLLVGAGEMSEGAAKALAQQGTLLTVVNRNQERAQHVAATCGGEIREWEKLEQELISADVVITSTASPRYVITREIMQGVIRTRRHRPLFLIDIAVPRDIDPRVENMDNVFLFDIDDLEQVASQNIAARKREADQAERIVEEEVSAFEAWQRSLDLTPTIVALRERVRGVVLAELERTLPRLSSLTEADKKILNAMAEATTNKLLHRPLTELKKARDEPDGPTLIKTVKQLFDLDLSQTTESKVEARGSAREQNSEPPAPATPALSRTGEGS